MTSPAPDSGGTLPRLVTQRLVLELPPPHMAAAVADYCRRNRERLKPLEPSREPSYYTAGHWETALESALREAQAGSGLRLMLQPHDEPGRIIGVVALSAIQRGPFQACNLGYALDGASEGQGLMREALVALLDYTFGPLALHRVQAACQPDNRRSLALLARLSFRHEGFAPEYLHLDGRWCDHELLALHAPEWAARPRQP